MIYDMSIDFKDLKDVVGLIGIYAICNDYDDKHYVGQTKDIQGFYKRWRTHRKMLRDNKHENPYMQNSYNKNGEYRFKFKILELVEDQNNLDICEKKWIDQLKSRSTENGWNIDYFDDKYYRKQGDRIPKKIKEYVVLSPDNKIYKFTNINKFKINQGLVGSAFGEMLAGNCKSSKGWKSLNPEHIKNIEATTVIYNVISPDEKMYTFSNPSQFMKQHSINCDTRFYRMLKGSVEYCLGWRLNTTEKKYREILSPWGEIIKFTKDSEICGKYGLSPSKISELFQGKRKSTNGWKLPYVETHYHEVISPLGDIHKVYNVSEFVRLNDLNNSNFNRLLTGKLNCSQGWRLKSYNPLTISTRT